MNISLLCGQSATANKTNLPLWILPVTGESEGLGKPLLPVKAPKEHRLSPGTYKLSPNSMHTVWLRSPHWLAKQVFLFMGGNGILFSQCLFGTTNRILGALAQQRIQMVPCVVEQTSLLKSRDLETIWKYKSKPSHKKGKPTAIAGWLLISLISCAGLM